MKLTDRPSDKNHFSRIAYSFSEKRVFFLLSVLSVLVSVVTLWNAVRLWTAIDRRMQNYVTTFRCRLPIGWTSSFCTFIRTCSCWRTICRMCKTT